MSGFGSTPVFHLQAGSSGGGTFTSASFNSTGADLIVLVLAGVNASAVITDNKGNSWNSSVQDTNVNATVFWYCYPTSVGAGHTITATGTSFASFYVEGWSGSDGTSAPLTNHNNGFGGGTAQAGSITPASNGELIIAGLCATSGASATINQSFTITDQADSNPGNTFGGAIAYLVQGTAAAVNPTWTSTTSYGAIIAAFPAGTGGGGTTVNLTGQSATFAEGTITAAVANALTGQSATFTEGSITRGVANALTGQTATFTIGTITVSVSYPITGQSATFTEGTITPSQGGQSVNLTGQSATFSIGTITPSITYVLSGQTATFSEGAIGPQLSYGLSGQSASFSEGSLVSSVSLSLTGLTARFTEGTITASGGTTVSGLPHDVGFLVNIGFLGLRR